MEFLLHSSADVNAIGWWSCEDGYLRHESPLMLAIGLGCDYDLVKALLEGGADVGCTQADGKTHIVRYAENCIKRACNGRLIIKKFRLENLTRRALWIEKRKYVQNIEAVLPLLQSYPPRPPSNVEGLPEMLHTSITQLSMREET